MLTYPLFAMSWTEYERGWGCRPDGFTFHSSVEEFQNFLREFLSHQPKQVPDEYSQADKDTPFVMMVSESLYEYVVNNGSVWLHHNRQDAYQTFDASTLKPKKHSL